MSAATNNAAPMTLTCDDPNKTKLELERAADPAPLTPTWITQQNDKTIRFTNDLPHSKDRATPPRVAFLVASEWVKFPLTEKDAPFTSPNGATELAVQVTPGPPNAPARTVYSITLKSGPQAGSTINNIGQSPGDSPPKPHALNEWCHSNAHEETYLVCVDLANDEVKVINRDNPGSLILEPNRSTRVMVQYGSTGDNEISVEMAGELKLFSKFRGEEASGNHADAEGGSSVVAYPIANFLFGPRPPGPAPVTVTLKPKKDDPANPPRVRKVELIVEETYLGALRFGIGAVFAGASDMSYEARQVDGSSQKEVTATSGGIADFEVVVGAAPFVFDLPNGRGAVTSGAAFAPYLGFGVLSVSSGGEVGFLKSIHLGLELEFAQNFSLAATFVIRRVDRLPEDLQIGSAVRDGTVPTTATIGFGPGLVINVSPDVLKVVGKGAGGLLN